MRGKAEERLHNGRLILVKVEHGDFIGKIEISGDFSLHPPEVLKVIERNLVGVEIESAESGIADIIEDTIREHHATLSYATPDDIARTVKKALLH